MSTLPMYLMFVYLFNFVFNPDKTELTKKLVSGARGDCNIFHAVPV